MTVDDKYYQGFVNDVVITLNLDEDMEKEFKKICESYGVNWKLDAGM